MSLALAAAAPELRAADPAPLEIHGALSATAGSSDQYNYLGETKDRLDLFSTEVTVNGTHRFANGVRFGAQLYGYKINEYRDLTLDFASLDYSFNESVGLRVGRSKQAVGLYGDTQDIDIIRPFALLPLNTYPKAMRSYGSSYDGAGLYGNVPVGGGSSFDYQVYAGWVPRYRSTDPWLRVMNDAAAVAVTSVEDAGHVIAGSLYWNTPLDGLKIGSSIAQTSGAKLTGVVRSTADLQHAAGDIRLFPAMLPPGVWDYMIAGHTGTTDMDRVTQMAYAAEYTKGNWLFAAEYHVLTVAASSTVPLVGTSPYNNRSDTAYVMATWQAMPKLQLASYYEQSYADTHDRSGRSYLSVPAHRAWHKDICGAACYSIAPWWLLKAEAHFINGTAILTGAGNSDAATWQPNWTFFVVKSTISF